MKIEKPAWLEQMEGILETLNEGVIISDDCQRILFLNDCMEQLIGRPRCAVVGRTPECFYHGDDFAQLQERIARRRNEGSNRFEFFIPRGGGDERVPVVISAREIEDPDGRTYAVVTFTDISEQKQAQKSLEEANWKLEQRAQEIERDLALASRVQQSLTPQSLAWGKVAVETYYMPARTIGGDFGVVTGHEGGHLDLLVGDVSGHGISSALVANRIYTETLSLLKRGSAPGELLHRLNSFVLHQIRTSGFYFTMAAARLHRNGRKLSFAGGGHPPAFWVTRSGECRHLESRNMVLGALENAVGDEPAVEVELEPGDRLVLYTDGLTEVFDKNEEMLGVAGLGDIVSRSAGESLEQMKDAVVEQVSAWSGGAIHDDMSLVLVEVS